MNDVLFLVVCNFSVLFPIHHKRITRRFVLILVRKGFLISWFYSIYQKKTIKQNNKNTKKKIVYKFVLLCPPTVLNVSVRLDYIVFF